MMNMAAVGYSEPTVLLLQPAQHICINTGYTEFPVILKMNAFSWNKQTKRDCLFWPLDNNLDNLKNIGRFQPHPPVLNTDAICHRMILISVFCSSYFVSLKLVDGAPSRSPVGAE